MSRMSASFFDQSSGNGRANVLTVAGIAIMLLGAGAAALPFLDRQEGNQLVGWLLLSAGLIEIGAATQRFENRILAMLAGAVTTAAGVLFLANPMGHFLPAVTIITAWLLVRSLVLALTSSRAAGSVRVWLGISAATDFALGMLMLGGLSIATFIVMLFGPTPQLVASFAWVFAISFLVTGGLLLEIASCFRDNED